MPFPIHDALDVLLNTSAAITADTNSNVYDFGVDGGCPEAQLEFTLGTVTRTTGTFALYYQSSSNGVDWTTSRLQIPGQSAGGDFRIPINNEVVAGRFLRAVIDVTFGAGESIAGAVIQLRPRHI